MLLKPLGRYVRDLLQSSWFFKQVRRARNNFHFLFATETSQRCSIHFDHPIVEAANYQQSRRLDLR